MRGLGPLAQLLDSSPDTTIIVGCGGLGVMTLDVLRSVRADSPVVFLDDNRDRIGSTLHGAPVLGPIEDGLRTAAEREAACVVAIAHNATRERIVAEHPDARYVSAIHARATISALATVGEGCIVLPGVAIDPEARIGRHVVINKLCSIGHNAVLDDFSQLAPLVGTGGHHRARSFVGMGASVLPGVELGTGAIVGAGAVVTRNVDAGATVAGVPARRTRS